MIDTIDILAYGGIAALVILLVVFEIRDRTAGGQFVRGGGYEYYTPDNSCVRVQHTFGSHYRIYVFSECPVQTSEDRLGIYFPIRAQSACEAEFIIDQLYQRRKIESGAEEV